MRTVTPAAGAGTANPRAIKAVFKRPLLLPGHAVCLIRDSQATDAGHGNLDWLPRLTQSIDFTIRGAAVAFDKPSITGQLLWGAQQPKL
jgi:hypothetical protein